MEVNKDEALRCLDIAKRHLSSGDLASARKFGLKSASLYPTPEAEAFITTVNREEAKSSSRGTKGSENRAETSTSSASQSAPDHKPAREYTEEQASAVREIQSSGGDFYKVLGIEKDATDAEIKKAYRKMVLLTHPDKNSAPGAVEAFKVLSKAYEVLSDPEKRAKLDREVPMESGSSRGETQHSTFRQRRPDGDRDPSANHDRAKSGQHSTSRQQGPSTSHDRAGSTGQQSTFRGSKDRASPGESSNMFSGQRPSHTSTGQAYRGARPQAQQTPNYPNYHQRQAQYREYYNQRRQQQRANNATCSSNTCNLMIISAALIAFVALYLYPRFLDRRLHDYSLHPNGNHIYPRHTTAKSILYFVDENQFSNTYFREEQSGWFNFKSWKVLLSTPDQQDQLFKRMEANVEADYLRVMRVLCKEEREEVRKKGKIGFWSSTPSCDILERKFAEKFG
ncbi:MAG: hypothetical protein J3Q66DRAFT_336005 [Benniella sp.]|nr:MAG: hypothetical protein J3Q66DRAFT_336005 [Benniella sp.]